MVHHSAPYINFSISPFQLPRFKRILRKLNPHVVLIKFIRNVKRDLIAETANFYKNFWLLSNRVSLDAKTCFLYSRSLSSMLCIILILNGGKYSVECRILWVDAQWTSKYIAAERNEVFGSTWNVFRTRSTDASSDLVGHCAFCCVQILLPKIFVPSPSGVVWGWLLMIFELIFPLNSGEWLRFNKPDKRPSFIVDRWHFSNLDFVLNLRPFTTTYLKYKN